MPKVGFLPEPWSPSSITLRTRDWEVRHYERAVTDWGLLRRYFELTVEGARSGVRQGAIEPHAGAIEDLVAPTLRLRLQRLRDCSQEASRVAEIIRFSS